MIEAVILNISFFGFWILGAGALLVFTNVKICLKLGFWLQAHGESLNWRRDRFERLKDKGN